MIIQGRRRSENVIDLRGFESITTMWGFNRYGVRGGALGEGLSAAQQQKKLEADLAAAKKRAETEMARKTQDAISRNVQKQQAEAAARKFQAEIAAAQQRVAEQKRAAAKLRTYIAAAQRRVELERLAKIAANSHVRGR